MQRMKTLSAAVLVLSLALALPIKTEALSLACTHYYEYTGHVEADGGHSEYTCKQCGYVLEVPDEDGHIWSGGIEKEDPWCTHDGYMKFTCGICGEAKTEILPEFDHLRIYIEIIKEPTCTEDGLYAGTCAFCGGRKEYSVPAEGHKLTEETVAPTYVTEGYTLVTCSKCGYNEKKDIIPALEKPAQNITVSRQTVSFKASKLKKAKRAFTIGAKTDGDGKLSYSVRYKNAKSKKVLGFRSGKVTIKKGTGKGTYAMTVRVSAVETDDYNAAEKTFKVTVKVK
ncbi:MAG: hypothetical protein IJ733_02330 [Lachnospiraceae bacterium]|nr:hypothetical protein [Lachnospiraceae bacterium]